MSDKCIGSVPAAAMAFFQDLTDFERGVIVGAREMGHSISEVAMKFRFSRTTISVPGYLWDALLHAVEKRSPPPRTPMDLLTALCEFPPGYLQTPVKSMPRRFASLLRARGGPTRY
ncbi:hypothetical protein AVEN_94323-1 [Araneus ventricosus]|uniref:Tc3 transposase DNA binding domain-containing protein n=1 Tax=Araneus ventricosus TaxID=182803 RepID=A0A4Y2NNS7_ARAVE|nr:hypothetical protein AVEN_94323-1 [Araneus ventricosus]